MLEEREEEAAVDCNSPDRKQWAMNYKRLWKQSQAPNAYTILSEICMFQS